ncbi:hypothetical protein N752_13015 [Desulforamulus aquiferis]|nr:SAM-dependent methyltransferase [Desulforamulus aquiferis]RYD04841.1 hypothetical protein N752_13015 [Desulforamulus aquiferis]
MGGVPIRSFHKDGEHPDETITVKLSENHPERLERKKWESLTRCIPDTPEIPTKTAIKNGSLYIIGSGMQVGHFSMEAIAHIKAADKVFYCIADAPGELYIQTLRPDAMDLYVLYSDSKIRYHTYVQMSEVLLYHLRLGFNVVGVFYGHPGVFVDPSHRAINIARREGFHAKMLPAISALDCLFADIGIDPSFPGLQTFESTDLLLRKRTINTDQHVVLWQVGCVLDSGFRRRGYLNHNLNILLDYLIEIYGEDYEVINYVAPVFCTLQPVIEKYKLSDLYNPDNAKKITGLSTWYLAPKVEQMPNVEIYKKLGLKIPDKPFKREMRFHYGEDELKALKALKLFKVPGDYKRTVATQTGKLMIELSSNAKKYHEYRKSPTQMLEKENDLTSSLKKKLINPPSWRLRVLTKPDAQEVINSFLNKLYTTPTFANQWNDVLSKYGVVPDGEKDVNNWLRQNGFDTTLEDIVAGQSAFDSSSLLPWSGVYTMNFDNCKIAVVGDETWYKSQIYYNGYYIKKFNYQNGVLSWSSADGNAVSANLTFSWKDTQHTQRLLQGKIWYPSQSEPTQNNSYGEADSYTSPLSVWQGLYKTFMKSGSSWVTGKAIQIDAANDSVTFGTVMVKNYTYDDGTLSWKVEDGNDSNAVLSFYMKPNNDGNGYTASFSGYVWQSGDKPTDVKFSGTLDTSFMKVWNGYYSTLIKDSQGNFNPGMELVINAGQDLSSTKVFYGGVEIKSFKYATPVLSWSEADGNDSNATLTFYQSTDGKNPSFSGTYYPKGGSVPVAPNMYGAYDAKYLSPWSGYYQSVLNDSSGPEVIIIGTQPGGQSEISVGGVEIKNFAFNNPVISWSDDNNNFNAIITVYTPQGSNVKQFAGYHWPKNGTKPEKPNWVGKIDISYLLSWSGNYYTYKKDDSGKWATGPAFQVIGGRTNEDSIIVYNGQTLQGWVFNNPVLTWSDTLNNSNGELKFYIPQPTDKTTVITPSFSAKVWPRVEQNPQNQIIPVH